MIKQVSKTGTKTEKKTHAKLVKHGDHWANESVRVVTSVKCHVPKFLVLVLKALTKQFPNDEFSIFCKSEFDEGSRSLNLLSEYFIPKQEVSAAAVDYKEDPPEGYDTVIHKHPTGCTSFSGTDDSYINQNHDISLLWENNSFREGLMRVSTKVGRIALDLDIESEEETLPNIPKEDLAKITHRVYVSTYSKKHTKRFSGKNSWSGFGDTKKSNKPRGGGGYLNTDQEIVNAFLNKEDDDASYDRYVDQVYELMQKDGITWEAAEEKYEESLKDDEEKLPDDLKNIHKLFNAQNATRIPGAVNATKTSIPGALPPVVVPGMCDKEKK